MAAAPHRGQHPPKCTGTPFLRSGCQTSPFCPPTPPPPLRLAWGALTCHAASLGQGGLLPTCREENRRVTDSLNFRPLKAQTSIRPGSDSCRKHGAEWWTHNRSRQSSAPEESQAFQLPPQSSPAWRGWRGSGHPQLPECWGRSQGGAGPLQTSKAGRQELDEGQTPISHQQMR